MDPMTVRRGLLYLGVFLLAAGSVAVLNAAGALDTVAVADAVATYWPVAVIAIGVALVARRSPAALPAGIVAAALPGIVLAGAAVAIPDVALPCTNADGPVGPAATREGSFGSTADIDLVVNCGEIQVTTQPGSAWRVDAADGDDRETIVTAETDRLSVTTERGPRRWNMGTDRVDWTVALPSTPLTDLRGEVNAGRGTFDLQGARLGELALVINAGRLDVDLTGATLANLDLELNAGAASVTLPAGTSFTGDLETNAGSLEVCAPAGLGLRVTATNALGSTQANGLIRRGDAWETPDYATAPFTAQLAIDASVGSVIINPQGGCK
jgi:hypothetical protein